MVAVCRTGPSIRFDAIVSALQEIQALGIGLVCITAGSPYYTPHLQRPAFYPPSDGYQPPEDPLIGVARLLGVCRQVKQRFPKLSVVGTGFTYLQDHLAAIAAGCIEQGWMDSVGLGRMGLSYPQLPADVLAGARLQKKLVCRTFSDCTTGPRNGLVSGCFPLDPHYKKSEDFKTLKQIRRKAAAANREA